MKQCIQCNKETNNPKFCSRNCAATFNNLKYPKRHKTKKCKKCSKLIGAGNIHCEKCRIPNDYSKYDELTIKDLEYGLEQLACNKHVKIRDRARTIYKNSKKPKTCIICGYNLHCDIAHIKPVSKFNTNAKLTEVNNIDNLVALCKNHHWEFDHGYISEEKLRCLMN